MGTAPSSPAAGDGAKKSATAVGLEAKGGGDGAIPMVDARLPARVVGGRKWVAVAGATAASEDAVVGEQYHLQCESGGSSGSGSGIAGHFTVMSFNILADRYCTERQHPCGRYRRWKYRRWKVLREVETHCADFVCLQEVEKVAYHWLCRELAECPGSKAQYAGGAWEPTGVQGPAILYRRDRWKLVSSATVPLCDKPAGEFLDTVMGPEAVDGSFPRGSRPYWLRRRLCGMHHVAVVCRFQWVPHDSGDDDGDGSNDAAAAGGADEATSTGSGGKGQRPCITVVNTHLHWAPSDSDLKTLQAAMLIEAVATELNKCKHVVVCGDLNSCPRVQADRYDGVLRVNAAYRLLTAGRVCEDDISRAHGEWDPREDFEAGVLTRLVAPLPGATGMRGGTLKSCYAAVRGSEPPFTNYTRGFKDCLDYIMWRDAEAESGCGSPVAALRPVMVLDTPAEEVLSAEEAIPSSVFPSDHVPLVAVFELGGTGGVTAAPCHRR